MSTKLLPGDNSDATALAVESGSCLLSRGQQRETVMERNKINGYRSLVAYYNDSFQEKDIFAEITFQTQDHQ